ncbi:hypothetical protein F5Y10DRAFT_246371 [Nemania abortiva]|nr:hypothetical protein F5Y10DRAFT_246371 [Nemania abortiva]
MTPRATPRPVPIFAFLPKPGTFRRGWVLFVPLLVISKPVAAAYVLAPLAGALVVAVCQVGRVDHLNGFSWLGALIAEGIEEERPENETTMVLRRSSYFACAIAILLLKGPATKYAAL